MANLYESYNIESPYVSSINNLNSDSVNLHHGSSFSKHCCDYFRESNAKKIILQVALSRNDKIP